MGAFQQLFKYSSDAVFGISNGGEILYWNSACEKMLGWTSDETRGEQCAKVLDGNDLHGNPFCGPDCPVRKKHAAKQIHGDFDLLIDSKCSSSSSTWVNIGIYYVPPDYREEAEGIDVFFSLRSVDSHRLLQRMANGTFNDTTRTQSLNSSPITAREVEVLQLATQGLNSKQIAEQLHICPATVKNHFRNIYAKLEVHNRAEAITVALQSGILSHTG